MHHFKAFGIFDDLITQFDSISVFPLHGWDIPSGADNSISHLYIQVNETNTILHFEDWQLFIWWRKKEDNVSLQCAVTYMFYFQGKSKRGSEAGYPFKYGGVWKGKTQCLKDIHGYGKLERYGKPRFEMCCFHMGVAR